MKWLALLIVLVVYRSAYAGDPGSIIKQKARGLEGQPAAPSYQPAPAVAPAAPAKFTPTHISGTRDLGAALNAIHAGGTPTEAQKSNIQSALMVTASGLSSPSTMATTNLVNDLANAWSTWVDKKITVAQIGQLQGAIAI